MNSKGRIVSKARKNQMKIQVNRYYRILSIYHPKLKRFRNYESIWEETLFFGMDTNSYTLSEKEQLAKFTEIWGNQTPQQDTNAFILPLFQKAYENKFNLDYEAFLRKL